MLTPEQKEALARAAALARPIESEGRDDEGRFLPLISEEVVQKVRASTFLSKEEREALGITSRWMVWAIRKGVRR